MLRVHHCEKSVIGSQKLVKGDSKNSSFQANFKSDSTVVFHLDNLNDYQYTDASES